MTDINKLKLLINAEIIENRSNYALFNEGMKKGSEIAQSIILHQNRWRKVEEEDIPVDQRVILRLGGYYSLITISDEVMAKYAKDKWKDGEWKPIE